MGYVGYYLGPGRRGTACGVAPCARCLQMCELHERETVLNVRSSVCYFFAALLCLSLIVP